MNTALLCLNDARAVLGSSREKARQAVTELMESEMLYPLALLVKGKELVDPNLPVCVCVKPFDFFNDPMRTRL